MVSGMKAKFSIIGYYREGKALCHCLLPSKWNVWFSHARNVWFHLGCLKCCYLSTVNYQACVFKRQYCERHEQRLQNELSHPQCDITATVSRPENAGGRNRTQMQTKGGKQDYFDDLFTKMRLKAQRIMVQVRVNTKKAVWKAKQM